MSGVLLTLSRATVGLTRSELIAAGLQETAFKRALTGQLIAIRGERYVLGIVGRQQLDADVAERDVKRCPCCGDVKPRDDFWKDAARADGLFAYCIGCAQERRRIEMEQKHAEACAAIVQAGRSAAEAAHAWDAACTALAASWRALLEADTVQRTRRRYADRDIEHGRLEARLVHPRAAYVLFRTLTAAGFPLPIPVHQVEGTPDALAEYVGAAPQEDYVDTVVIETVQTGGTEVPHAGPSVEDDADTDRADPDALGAGLADVAAAADVDRPVARKRGRPRKAA